MTDQLTERTYQVNKRELYDQSTLSFGPINLTTWFKKNVRFAQHCMELIETSDTANNMTKSKAQSIRVQLEDLENSLKTPVYLLDDDNGV